MRETTAVCFDLDNTLYPYLPCHAAGLAASRETAGAFGLYEDAAAHDAAYAAARTIVQKQLGSTAASHKRLLYYQQMVESRRGRFDADSVVALDRAYWQAYFAAMCTSLDPGARPLLEQLRARGIRTALVTDLTAEVQFAKLRALDFGALFDVVVTSEEIGADKPAPAILYRALEKLGTPPSRALFVGDSPERDGGAARAAGTPFVWLSASPDEWPERLPPPQAHVRDCAALARWIGLPSG